LLTSGIEGRNGYLVSEQATLQSGAEQAARVESVTSSEGVITSDLTSVVGDTLGEQALLADEPSSATSSVVAETCTISSAASHTATVISVLGESCSSQSGVANFALGILEETGYLDDGVLEMRSTSDSLGETAQLQSAVTSANRIQSVLEEAASFASGVVAQLMAQQTVGEIAYFESGAVLPSAGAAWTANLDSFGGSRFVDYPFISMAVVDGVPCGITRDALFRLDQKLDVESSVLTDKLGFGSMQQKRLSGVYLTGSCSGGASVEVGVEDDTSYEYQFKTASTDADKHTFRAQTGKGLRGSFWQLRIKSSGTGFVINSAAVDTAVSNRRV
jgi:hypothetical protein